MRYLESYTGRGCVYREGDTMNKRKVGTEKELLVAEFLTEHGIQVLNRNYRTARGEIDLIGYKDGVLIFFEVKYRRNAQFGYPQEAVHIQKQRTICMVSMQYLRECADALPDFRMVRYDVVSILDGNITWLQDAFVFRGKDWSW